MKNLSTDDTIGYHHIVILRGRNGLVEIIEFEGGHAMEQAHEFASNQAMVRNLVATVCMRVRTCGSYGLMKELGYRMNHPCTTISNAVQTLCKTAANEVKSGSNRCEMLPFSLKVGQTAILCKSAS